MRRWIACAKAHIAAHLLVSLANVFIRTSLTVKLSTSLVHQSTQSALLRFTVLPGSTDGTLGLLELLVSSNYQTIASRGL